VFVHVPEERFFGFQEITVLELWQVRDPYGVRGKVAQV
jgi:hypothetical protein